MADRTSRAPLSVGRRLLPSEERRWRLEDLGASPHTAGRAVLRAGRSLTLRRADFWTSLIRNSLLLSLYYLSVGVLLYPWDVLRGAAYGLWLGGAAQLLAVTSAAAVVQIVRRHSKEHVVLVGLASLGGLAALPVSAVNEGMLLGKSDRTRGDEPDELAAAETLRDHYLQWRAAVARDPEVAEIFDALLPEFEGTVGELLDVSRALAGTSQR